MHGKSKAKKTFSTTFLVPLDRIRMHFTISAFCFGSWYIHTFAIFYICVCEVLKLGGGQAYNRSSD
jgi:hypothetical protein